MYIAVAPDTVKIRLEPEELKPDTEATLICDSSSSNPPAQLSWWKEGIPINGKYRYADDAHCSSLTSYLS